MANEPVERVISLAPHATEIAYAAGLGDKLIAVSEMSDYPKEAGELEKVSNYQGIKLERIIALQPDLVIAWPAGNRQRARKVKTIWRTYLLLNHGYFRRHRK